MSLHCTLMLATSSLLSCSFIVLHWRLWGWSSCPPWHREQDVCYSVLLKTNFKLPYLFLFSFDLDQDCWALWLRYGLFSDIWEENLSRSLLFWVSAPSAYLGAPSPYLGAPSAYVGTPMAYLENNENKANSVQFHLKMPFLNWVSQYRWSAASIQS